MNNLIKTFLTVLLLFLGVFILFEKERAVIGGKDVDFSGEHGGPEFLTTGFVTKRRRADKFGALEPGFAVELVVQQ